MDAATVTVVTPTFNAAATIARCMESVRSQQGVSVEHLVVDGGSTDGTLDIVARSGVRHVSERDAGIYDAMSKGVRLAGCEYVHILNADDRYAGDDVLAEIVERMRRDRLDLCHGMAAHVDAAGKEIRTFGRSVPRHALLKKMRIAHPTVVVRREIYQRFGAFSIGFRIAGDHEFLLRIWDRIAIGFIPRVQVLMEIGGASTNGANVAKSYRESMAAAIMHGANPIAASMRYWYEVWKHRLVFARRYRNS
jgi:glycosyltransferase involved in cell wall biosynthesis